MKWSKSFCDMGQFPHLSPHGQLHFDGLQNRPLAGFQGLFPRHLALRYLMPVKHFELVAQFPVALTEPLPVFI